MQLEIEQKFAVEDAGALIQQITRLGGRELPPVEQQDTYYNHPSRDFRITDEAFRIRQTGDSAVVTYKGPKLNAEVKTRPEIEIPLVACESWPRLLAALGFREVATVSKSRRRFSFERETFEIELAVDDVERVGLFAEVEIVADPSHVDAAQRAVQSLAADLGLCRLERRSYLSMLLSSDK